MEDAATTPSLKISVVIPSRNRAELLRLTLEGLVLQKRIPNEIIVVDNDSTDHTAAVVKEFEGRLPVRYLVEKRRGAAAARNLGIRHATGDILAFTDDDCVPDPLWVHYLELSFLRDPSIGMIAGKILPFADAATWAEQFAAENHLLCEGEGS